MLKKKLKPSFGKKSIILIAVAVALIAADLLTKYFEERFVWNAVIIPGFAEIESGHRNPGCAFSFLADNPSVGQPILIALTIVLLAVLIFGFIFIPERFTVLKTAVSIVIAGAIGNLVDRIFIPFAVRDWFGLWMFGNMTYCNFADFWIVIGVALAIVDLLFFNEWAVFPLTKKAKEAQAARKAEEEFNKNKEDNGENQQ
ncbi:MAG: signal peptidase II [Clostridia bacterium]|nr:signal peptidase II [Clostridia bacterium]